VVSHSAWNCHYALCQNATLGVWPVSVGSAYYVLNPQGDLKKTQELFSKKFLEQEGWEGVVGAPPTLQNLKGALENKALYM